MPHNFLSPIEDIIEDAKNGRMFILIDDEDRENEGDLIIPAQMATPDAVNFMAKYGRGLICLTLDRLRAEQLGLPPMSRHNRARNNTAFTVSIEAREGITTGISAADRAHTIAVAINSTQCRDDIVSPGHVFPIVAKDGGVLVRAGHTEAAVDIARLAGLHPSGVVCEVMKDDGTMARLPDLIEFAKKHDLKVATIADLIAYRRKVDNLVGCVEETMIESEFGGEFRLCVYEVKDDHTQHVALIKGDPKAGKPALVRMHPFNLMGDILAVNGPRCNQLHRAMAEIGQAECGILVYLRESAQSIITDSIARQRGSQNVSRESFLRGYGIGAQILVDLGVQDLILLSDTAQHVVGIDGYGLNIIEQRKFDESITIGITKNKKEQ